MKKHIIFLSVITIFLAFLLCGLNPLNSKINLGKTDTSNQTQTIQQSDSSENDNIAKATVSEDDNKAKTVDDLIAFINNPVSLNDKTSIETARKAYDDLTDEQKVLVKTLPDLEKAESDFSKLGQDIDTTYFNIGDTVNFKGGKVYVSPTANKSSATRPASKCTITLVSKTSEHLYHLVSLDSNEVYGWVNAEDVEK
jgi:hypothetical protein